MGLSHGLFRVNGASVEVLVTVCCLLVGVLVLSNSRRRHESCGFPRLVVWAAFMFNYPVISYSIGLMQSSSIKNELFVVWACFLLLLLGSTNTMTAFSFNDSNHQATPRHGVASHRLWRRFFPPHNLALAVRGADPVAVAMRKDLCLSFALFKMLRLRFGTDHAGDIQFKFQGDKCRDFIVKGLLSNDQDLDRAYRVVETARYMPTQGTQNIFINGFNVDLLITRLVILWYIVIESYQFIACLIFSDWHKVKMLCRYVRNESWHNRLLVEIPLKVLCHFTFSKHWKGTMGQYFLLYDTHPHWFKSFLSWISLKSLDSSLMTSSTKVDSDVKHAVLLQLKNYNGKITDGMMPMYEMGLIDPSLDRTCWIGHKYADYIQEWHPELVPASTYESLSLSRGTLQNAQDFLTDCKSNKDKYGKLMNLGRSSQANFEFLTVYKGAQIAVHLTEKSRVKDDEELRWNALASFWANMILYIAPSDRAVAHAAKMATGGEFYNHRVGYVLHLITILSSFTNFGFPWRFSSPWRRSASCVIAAAS
ncbi:hypothetical protein HU200_056009 [Digitaria exilis]|uniref:DUF4220 domain-containing protein n=1 Tax=Digitaria exilis TaxID=1010633 RepID=A0A835AFV4_9POAL|nr:hypothetical protein HU200_056009 [Digitaria exilis]